MSVTENTGHEGYQQGLARGRWLTRFVVVVVYTTGCRADPDFGNCEHDVSFTDPSALRAIHGNHLLTENLTGFPTVQMEP